MILHGYIIKIMKKNKDQAVSDSELKQGVLDLINSQKTFKPDMGLIKE